jgi:RNA polymerase sigma-70 factor (ECF subfamily)
VTDEWAGRADLGAAYSLHRGRIYRYLLRRTRQREDAEDLTQTVFLEAGLALAKGMRPTSLLGWLLTVAERRFIDETRRRARRAGSVDHVSSDLLASPSSEYGREIVAALRQGLEQLSTEHRRVVVAKVFEGRAFAEIARREGITEAACKMRFVRGIRQLRDFLRAAGVQSR